MSDTIVENNYRRELIEIETRAGIADQAEQIRSTPPNYIGAWQSRGDSTAQHEAEEEAEASNRVWRAQEIRKLYFAVSDLELRTALIAKDREWEKIICNWLQGELSDARRALAAAKLSHRDWWLWASVTGVLLISLGAQAPDSTPGAMAGLLVGYFNGRRLEANAARARADAICAAEQLVDEAQSDWNRVRDQKPVFSSLEQQTGQRDTECY